MSWEWLYVEWLSSHHRLIWTGSSIYAGSEHQILAWGGIFSPLNPLPILFMVLIHSINSKTTENRGHQSVGSLIGRYGCALIPFNRRQEYGDLPIPYCCQRWTHGTQYRFTVISAFWCFMPYDSHGNPYAINRNWKAWAQFNQKRGFWFSGWQPSSMAIMGLAFGVAGVIQSYMWRGLGMDFLAVQGFMRPWFMIVLLGGLVYFLEWFYTSLILKISI